MLLLYLQLIGILIANNMRKEKDDVSGERPMEEGRAPQISQGFGALWKELEENRGIRSNEIGDSSALPCAKVLWKILPEIIKG